LSTIEPNCFEEARKDEFWNKAMDKELDQIMQIGQVVLMTDEAPVEQCST
jgi:hypothetical protein